MVLIKLAGKNKNKWPVIKMDKGFVKAIHRRAYMNDR